MKKTIYLYVLDTLADWEIGNILQIVSMQSMLLKQEAKFNLKTVALTRDPIKTLGGLTLIPDCSLQEIDDTDIAAMLLPGANTWSDPTQKPILDLVASYVDKGILVGAICGATVALAELGVLDNHEHTSNSREFLCAFSPNYKGQSLYKEDLSVVDGNIITASSAGGLLWAKQIVEHLNIYPRATTEMWYQYYLTGDSKILYEILANCGVVS